MPSIRVTPTVHILFYVVLIALTSGCASLTGTRQTVKLATDLDHADVYLERKKIGTAPGFFDLKRRSSQKLTLKRKNLSKKLTLESKYRWGYTVFGNLFFGQYVFAGVLIDLLSGAAWEYQKPEIVKFAPKREIKPLAPQSLVIAPPQFKNEFVSDEVAEELLMLMKERYPNVRIKSYDSEFETFAAFGYNSEFIVQEKYRDGLYRNLNTTHIVESKISVKDNTYSVQTEVIDVFRDQTVDEFTARSKAKYLKSSKSGKSSYLWSFFYGLVPNAIGVENSSLSEGVGWTDSHDLIRLQPEPTGYFGTNIAFTTSNLKPPKTQDGFYFYFDWRSKFIARSMSFKLRVEDATEPSIHLYQLGIGFGPEVGFNFHYGSFYLQFIGLPSYYFVKYDDANVNPRSYWQGSFDTLTELGYAFPVSDRSILRIYSRGVDHDHKLEENLVRRAVPDLWYIDPFTYVAGVSFEYFFPEARRRVKKLL